MRVSIILLGAAVITGAAAGCTLRPDYNRPAVTVPEAYRSATPLEPAAPDTVSTGDQTWWDLFQDDELRELIRTALLQQNVDPRIAATRILEASGAQLAAGVSWEIEFWGKYRRAKDAARASMLASEWGRRAVAATLVSQIASGYFKMRAFDLQLNIATKTLAARRESLRLSEVMTSGGMTPAVDTSQAQQLVFNAGGTISGLESQIAQQEQYISVLLGRNPSDIPRGVSLEQPMQLPEVPAGLPSALLERRPDVRQAEQLLVAANANISVAKAAYFPQISLTGSGGVESAALSDLFTKPAEPWSAGAGPRPPIFITGRTPSRVALSKAQQGEALLAYQQTIQRSLGDVLEALAGYRKGRDSREQQLQMSRSAADARHTAEIRYRGGAAGYLEVLDSDIRMFSVELAATEAELSELLSLVQIYRALGGGWQNAPGGAHDGSLARSGGR
jgi:multidrug efflux system outer membrane protein